MNNTGVQETPRTILIVDDELAVLTVVKCMLESCDYNILMANSATSALQIARNKDLGIDLMITDVVMPDMQGPDLAERVRELRPQIRVLFMSGYTDAEVVRVKVLDSKLSFLRKPFTSDGLRESVRRLLEMPLSLAAAR